MNMQVSGLHSSPLTKCLLPQDPCSFGAQSKLLHAEAGKAYS